MNCHTRTELNYKLPAYLIWDFCSSGIWHQTSGWFALCILGPLGCPTTLDKNHPVTWCHIPEEWRPHLQCCEGLKSHILPYRQLCVPKCNTYDNQYGLEVSYEAYQSIFGLLYEWQYLTLNTINGNWIEKNWDLHWIMKY